MIALNMELQPRVPVATISGRARLPPYEIERTAVLNKGYLKSVLVMFTYHR